MAAVLRSRIAAFLVFPVRDLEDLSRSVEVLRGRACEPLDLLGRSRALGLPLGALGVEEASSMRPSSLSS
jgi:hypothetical protein